MFHANHSLKNVFLGTVHNENDKIREELQPETYTFSKLRIVGTREQLHYKRTITLMLI